jgi:hypothetical protein
MPDFEFVQHSAYKVLCITTWPLFETLGLVRHQTKALTNVIHFLSCIKLEIDIIGFRKISFYWNISLYGLKYRGLPITVATWSEAWTVLAHSNAGIVGSNPTQGMDVCVRLFWVSVVLHVGSGLVARRFPVQEVLPSVYRIKKLK